MSDDVFKTFVERLAAGQELTPHLTASKLLGNDKLTVARMLEENPLGLDVELNEITAGMMLDWRNKIRTYEKAAGDDRERSDIADIEMWINTVKAAIVCKWFKTPSGWTEGSAAKMPPSHVHWLSDLLWLHQVELKSVPFLSG